MHPSLAETCNDPAGTRTHDPRIKSPMLYQLSYEVSGAGMLQIEGCSVPTYNTRRYSLDFFDFAVAVGGDFPRVVHFLES